MSCLILFIWGGKMNKNTICFQDILNIGSLYFDKCFIEFGGEPILFSCTDINSTPYLCLCSDIRLNQKWVISKTDINTLESLIKQEIDILTALTKNEKCVIIIQDIDGKEQKEYVNTHELNELDLPKMGVYLHT